MGEQVSRDPASIRKNSLSATAAIVLSRVFGLVREQVFAFFFGAGYALDAFIAAFRIPNLLRDLFAEGALSQSFVAVFSKKSAEDPKAAFRLADKVVTLLVLVMTVVVVLGVIFSPRIVGLVAQGFTGEKFLLTVKLNRILFPFILFVSLAALSMGMLNARGRFFLPQSASTCFNIVSIAAGLAFAWLLAPDYMLSAWSALRDGSRPALGGPGVERAIVGMAAGTLAGGIAQWLVQSPALWRLGYRPRPDFGFKDPDVQRVLNLTGPSVIGGAAVQVNVMVNTYFASFLSHGAISYLNYAFRLMQFPLGVFGVAIASASAPALAVMAGEGRDEDFRKTFRSAIRMSLFLSLPSAAGLVVLAGPIISLIYEHGRFGALDTTATAHALMAYALGVASYSLIKIYQPAYLAFHDARTPMLIAMLSIALNTAIGWTFIRVLGWPHWGLALGTSILATVDLILLAALFRRKTADLWSGEARLAVIKMAAGALVMGLSAWGTLQASVAAFGGAGIAVRLAHVLIPMTVAVPVYLGVCRMIGVEDATSVMNALRARMGRRQT